MPPDPRVHVGVAAIVESDDTLLMIRRGGSGDGHGTWSLPGGWLDFGEAPHEAAVREVAEETGVRVRPVAEDGFVCCTSYNGEFQIVTLFVRCEFQGGNATVTEPDKCPEVRWMPLAALDALPLFAPVQAWRDRA